MTELPADALNEVYAHIISRAPEHDIDPTLDRVVEVLDLLGNPHQAYRVIHVAGTNGKSSTSRMIDSLIREHGLRTGRFTSPHLTSVTERISVDGEPISDERFVEVWQDVAPYVHMVDAKNTAEGRPRLSFFEVLTVMAFAAFADAPIDVAIIEVGLGGLWDCTNVANGEVAVITPIALDHERFLGTTIKEVATQKAGIIKPDATVVISQQKDDALEVLLAAAAAKDDHVVRDGDQFEVLDRHVAVGGQMLTLRTTGGIYSELYLPLHGRHQAHNALVALAAAEALLTGGRALSGEIVEAAFAQITSPGRLELVRTSPTILVDGAHNPAGAEALADALDEVFALNRLVGVVGQMADKDVESFLSILEPVFSEIVVTTPISDRAMDIEALTELAVEVFGEDRVHRADRLDDAIDQAATLAESGGDSNSGVVITGSLITVAQARILLGVK